VQIYFPEDVDEVPLAEIFSATALSMVDVSFQKTNIEDSKPNTAVSESATVLAAILLKIQQLAVLTHLAPPTHLTEPLQQLDSLLDIILANSTSTQVLPKQKRIAPNQSS